MTGLLVSVRDAAEARDALAGGADLIDVKEPNAGSLGAAKPEVIADVIRAVAGRRPVSAAFGELREHSAERIQQITAAPALANLSYVKLGLAGCASIPDWAEHWEQTLRLFPNSVKAVAVAYADWKTADAPPPDVVIEIGGQFGCGALLIDTFDKQRPGLLAALPIAELARIVRAARAVGMVVVLGGRIAPDDFASLLLLESDYLAVRGAVCRGGRESRLDQALVRQVKERLVKLSRGGPHPGPLP